MAKYRPQIDFSGSLIARLAKTVISNTISLSPQRRTRYGTIQRAFVDLEHIQPQILTKPEPWILASQDNGPQPRKSNRC